VDALWIAGGEDERGVHLVHFLSEELLTLPQFHKDITKVRQLKRQGGCRFDRAMTGSNEEANPFKDKGKFTLSRFKRKQ
jgi:hypothetical protein